MKSKKFSNEFGGKTNGSLEGEGRGQLSPVPLIGYVTECMFTVIFSVD